MKSVLHLNNNLKRAVFENISVRPNIKGQHITADSCHRSVSCQVVESEEIAAGTAAHSLDRAGQSWTELETKLGADTA